MSGICSVTSDGRSSAGSTTCSMRQRAMPLSIVEHLADRHRPVAADVVDLARGALLEQQPVRAHRVAHVGEGAHAVEVADPHRVAPPAGLDLGDLLRERALGEHVAAARPGVREHARADGLHPVGEEVLQRDHVLADLRRPRTGWPAGTRSSRGSAPRRRSPGRRPRTSCRCGSSGRCRRARTASSRLVVPITLVCSVSAGAMKLDDDVRLRGEVEDPVRLHAAEHRHQRGAGRAARPRAAGSRRSRWPRCASSGLRQRTRPWTSTSGCSASDVLGEVAAHHARDAR